MEYDDYKCTVIKIDNEYTYSFEPLDINGNDLGMKKGGKKTRSNKQKRKRNTKRKNNIVL